MQENSRTVPTSAPEPLDTETWRLVDMLLEYGGQCTVCVCVKFKNMHPDLETKRVKRHKKFLYTKHTQYGHTHTHTYFLHSFQATRSTLR